MRLIATLLGAALLACLAAPPAPAQGCTSKRFVLVRAPKGADAGVIYRDGRPVGTVHRGVPRRVWLRSPPGVVVTIEVIGRTRTGMRAVRTRRVRRCLGARPAPGTPLPTPSRPTAALLRYEGRWDITSRRATTVNSGSRVFLRFTGTEVTARFDVDGITRPPHVYAYVDGRRSERIVVDEPRIRLTPPGLDAGEHTLVLAVKDVDENAQRWRRPFRSALQLEGFEVAGGALREPTPPATDLRFTFLGDSITQGINILCSDPGPKCADGTLDYAWRVADAFDAGLEQVGFGGQGLTNGGGGDVPAAIAALDHNFEGSAAGAWAADVVVVNQGTNDMGRSEAAIRSAYLEYLREVRARYPGALIIVLEPFGFWGWGVPHVSAAAEGAVAELGDPRARYVPTRGWLRPEDFTDGIHPDDVGHRRAAERLTETITSLTGRSRR